MWQSSDTLESRRGWESLNCGTSIKIAKATKERSDGGQSGMDARLERELRNEGSGEELSGGTMS